MDRGESMTLAISSLWRVLTHTARRKSGVLLRVWIVSIGVTGGCNGGDTTTASSVAAQTAIYASPATRPASRPTQLATLPEAWLFKEEEVWLSPAASVRAGRDLAQGLAPYGTSWKPDNR